MHNAAAGSEATAANAGGQPAADALSAASFSHVAGPPAGSRSRRRGSPQGRAAFQLSAILWCGSMPVKACASLPSQLYERPYLWLPLPTSMLSLPVQLRCTPRASLLITKLCSKSCANRQHDPIRHDRDITSTRAVPPHRRRVGTVAASRGAAAGAHGRAGTRHQHRGIRAGGGRLRCRLPAMDRLDRHAGSNLSLPIIEALLADWFLLEASPLVALVGRTHMISGSHRTRQLVSTDLAEYANAASPERRCRLRPAVLRWRRGGRLPPCRTPSLSGRRTLPP